jgi:hypothetical protein
MDFLRNPGAHIKQAFRGPRTDYPPAVRRWLAQNGERPIESLTVMRTPIQSGLHKALDAITLGRWESAKRASGYDSLYHLALVAEYSDARGTRRAVLEKNHVINIGNEYHTNADTEHMLVSLPKHPELTFNRLLDSGLRLVGPEAFFRYDAFSNNCQAWVMSLLRGSGLSTPQLETFVLQPVDHLLTKLPGYTSAVAKGVTDLAGVADVMLNGAGLERAVRAVVHDLHGAGML